MPGVRGGELRSWPDDYINKIIYGDCLDVMKEMPDKSIDVIITDPPYMGHGGAISFIGGGGVAKAKVNSRTVGNIWMANYDGLLEFERIAKYGAIVFTSWHRIGEVKTALGGACVGLISWVKRNSMPSFRNRPRYMCEYIWLVEYKKGISWKRFETFYDFPMLSSGCISTGERMLEKNSKKALHPTQKPIQLMAELVRAGSDEGWLILDPYAGTGTTIEACKLMKRNFIGIELNEEYIPLIEKRTAQGVL